MKLALPFHLRSLLVLPVCVSGCIRNRPVQGVARRRHRQGVHHDAGGDRRAIVDIKSAVPVGIAPKSGPGVDGKTTRIELNTRGIS